jgi:hypothetical protein
LRFIIFIRGSAPAAVPRVGLVRDAAHLERLARESGGPQANPISGLPFADGQVPLTDEGCSGRILIQGYDNKLQRTDAALCVSPPGRASGRRTRPIPRRHSMPRFVKKQWVTRESGITGRVTELSCLLSSLRLQYSR